ncbi:hypothetical protein GCM10028895_01700 [Pontibacter rugosus]
MNDSDFVAAAKNKVVFVDGWLYRDYKDFEKHAASIRKIFTPLPKYTEQVEEVINRCMQLGDTIIGVHIRRGDYKTYNNGKWFYEDDVYYKKMNALKQQLEAEGKKCVFLICSNEKINKNNYPGLPIVTEDRHFIVDLYALSRCHYLIGPQVPLPCGHLSTEKHHYWP